MTALALALISATLLIYGASIWGMASALAWFHKDCREKLPQRLDRIVAMTVIYLVIPFLAARALVDNAHNHLQHRRVHRAIRRLPAQADPEQQHLVDEIKNERFYDAAHHPAGTIGGDQ